MMACIQQWLALWGQLQAAEASSLDQEDKIARLCRRFLLSRLAPKGILAPRGAAPAASVTGDRG